ncbi:MAG TPA: hypothetical protein VNQ77_13930 [Frankiaceae bacterium]|nr:hypothetical protein [Frankiaceae bacterium]
MFRTIVGAAVATAALVLVPAPAAHAEETDPQLCYGVWTTAPFDSGAGPVCVPWPAGTGCGTLEQGLGPVVVVALVCLPKPFGEIP